LREAPRAFPPGAWTYDIAESACVKGGVSSGPSGSS
jgi:hypothetical protein